MDRLQAIASELLGTSIWEAVAVLLALAYLVLAIRRSLWCWACALISSAIYMVLMADAGLVMNTLLQVYYLVMAVYGYLQWRRGSTSNGELLIVSWTLRQHGMAIAVVLLITTLNAFLLPLFITMAQSPWLDAFVTWGSVLTTFMVARRVVENWLYWIVIDGLAAYLYYSRGLVATALLFIVYVGMVIHGYIIWRRSTTPALHKVAI